MLMTLAPNLQLNMYVDVDFAGLWHKEFSQLRECALSRTGYLITYCDCPIHWTGKHTLGWQATNRNHLKHHQSQMHCSIHGRLCTVTTVTIRSRNSLITTSPCIAHSKINTKTLATANIYEDNALCIISAYSNGTKVRMKHIWLKWHHFCDQIHQGHI